jgi:methionyl-tRNA formyltransferase
MRVAFFGSGSPMSTLALDALAPRFEVALVVVPAGRASGGWRGARRRLHRRRARRPLVARARGRGIPVHAYAPGSEPPLLAALGASRADVLCVATFPHLIPAAVLEAARLGALGLHPSLLPRHRGPAPLFWTYHDGDAEAGVSVFWMDQGEDTGDIALQETIVLPRGRAGPDLYAEVAVRGAALLARAVEDAAAGSGSRRAQEAAGATREPRPTVRTCRVELEHWAPEPLWHFLSGVGGAAPFVRDAGGRGVLHGAVRGWSGQPLGPPGAVETLDGGLRLHCRGGHVDVRRAPLLARARALLQGGGVRP